MTLFRMTLLGLLPKTHYGEKLGLPVHVVSISPRGHLACSDGGLEGTGAVGWTQRRVEKRGKHLPQETKWATI